MSDQSNRQLTLTAFKQREHMSRHHSYEEDMQAYTFVKLGDCRSIDASQKVFLGEQTGLLSRDPLRNKQYLFVAAVTLTTRFAIDGGLEPENAYNLSDMYILKVDQCTSIDAINKLHKDMVIDFTERVAQEHHRQFYTRPVHLCMDYIYNHLHEAITVKELADYVHLSPNYLSQLFKKETGYTIAGYIRFKRLETAENLLKYSELSINDISNILMFSSCSHFVKVFKAHSGTTPKVYRDRYFRKSLPSKA